MNENQGFGNLLTDPISFGDLLGSGATLQMNANYENGITDEIYDEIYGSDDDDEDDKLNHVKDISPWQGSFEELKTQMTAVDDSIFKRILEYGNVEKGKVPENSRVSIRYSSYFQGESAPFDSNVFSFNTGENNVLEGLEKAVYTMYEGEKAQFIISYRLLFGELGCPPRIKKRADGLYVIELISHTPLHQEEKSVCQKDPEDRKKFVFAFQIAKELELKGLNFSKQGMYRNAVEAFDRAGNILDHCHLANEEEEREQSKFLNRLYTNLMVAYNKLKKPNKACIIYRKIWQLTNNKPSCKVLFQHARALSMLGEYTRAKDVLQRAQRIEPDNVEVKKELEDVEKRYKQFNECNQSIRKNLLGLEDNDNEDNDNDSPIKEDHLHDFKKNIHEILQDFKNKSDEKTNLPSNLTEEEISIVDELTKELDMKLSFSETENSYSVCK